MAGLLLAVTLNATAALAVVTIAPRIPVDLGRLDLYGWLFSAYLLASLAGNVWGGAAADRFGIRRPFTLALTLFAAGTLLAALAPSMPVVILARVLQGFAGGVLTICVYVAVTAAFPDSERARMLAYLSSAWVLPALVGPALAGLLAGGRSSWRCCRWRC
jgi:MFS family permease